jgi:hypothetical protein
MRQLEKFKFVKDGLENAQEAESVFERAKEREKIEGPSKNTFRVLF